MFWFSMERGILGIELYYDRPSPWVRQNQQWEQWRPQNIPATIKYPELPLFELGRHAATQVPEKTAIHYVPTENKISYQQLMGFSDKLAAALYDLGVQKGDAVALMTRNCPEFIYSIFGITLTGAAACPINPLLRKKEIKHVITDSEIINTIIIQNDLLPLVKQALEELNIQNIITIGEKTEPGTLSFTKLIEDYLPEPPNVKIAPKKDLAVLAYTGGTTGLPKGVMLTHHNIVSNVTQYAYTWSTKEELDQKYSNMARLIFLPICHIMGFLGIIGSIFRADMIILWERFNAKEILEAIEKYKVDRFIGTPTIFVYLLEYLEQHKSIKQYDLSSLQRIGASSAGLPPEIAKKVKEWFGHEQLSQGYGLTECGVVMSQPPWLNIIDSRSVGIPIIDTDVKIIDLKTGDECGPEEAGELLIRGPQIMQGYWKHPERTAATITEGWLHTGDIAKMNEDGYFYIIGRTKEMIKYKGYRIFPQEVEKTLHEHPGVKECAVIGIPDLKVGEVITAYVSLNKQYRGKVTEEDIINFCKERMAAYKYPRVVKFKTLIPKTAVGKIARRDLLEKELAKINKNAMK